MTCPPTSETPVNASPKKKLNRNSPDSGSTPPTPPFANRNAERSKLQCASQWVAGVNCFTVAAGWQALAVSLGVVGSVARAFGARRLPQRLQHVGDRVLGILDPAGQAHQPIRDADGGALFGAERAVRGH